MSVVSGKLVVQSWRRALVLATADMSKEALEAKTSCNHHILKTKHIQGIGSFKDPAEAGLHGMPDISDLSEDFSPSGPIWVQ